MPCGRPHRRKSTAQRSQCACSAPGACEPWVGGFRACFRVAVAGRRCGRPHGRETAGGGGQILPRQSLPCRLADRTKCVPRHMSVSISAPAGGVGLACRPLKSAKPCSYFPPSARHHTFRAWFWKAARGFLRLLCAFRVSFFLHTTQVEGLLTSLRSSPKSVACGRSPTTIRTIWLAADMEGSDVAASKYRNTGLSPHGRPERGKAAGRSRNLRGGNPIRGRCQAVSLAVRLRPHSGRPCGESPARQAVSRQRGGGRTKLAANQ